MPTESERNQQILRRWFEGGVWNTDDVEAAEAYIDAHYAPQGRAYGLGGTFVEGPAAFKGFRRAFVAAFAALHFEVTHSLAEGPLVAMRWVATMTTHEGAEHELQGGGFSRLEDGRIVECWNLIDFGEFLERVRGERSGASLEAFMEHQAALA